MKTQTEDVAQVGKSGQKTCQISWEKKFTGKCNYSKKVGHNEKNC